MNDKVKEAWGQRAESFKATPEFSLVTDHFISGFEGGYCKGLTEYRQALKRDIEREIMRLEYFIEADKSSVYYVHMRSAYKEFLELLDTCKP